MENDSFELDNYQADHELQTFYEDYSTTFNYTLDSIDLQIPENSIKKKSRGRKVRPENVVNILQCFFKNSKAPKKEYIRCKIIRGQKRAIRHALNNKIPTTTLHKVNHLNPNEIQAWNNFVLDIIKNSDTFIKISKTENGPKTDGAAKRKNKEHFVSSKIQKTFNDHFCKGYFFNPLVLENYKLYIDVIFALNEPENLVKRFDFSCCRSRNISHFPDCYIKWENLKQYLKVGMIEDLGITKSSLSNAMNQEISECEFFAEDLLEQ
ncbi:hypothetical protein SteCoe_33702 [Stentor coeruleus]|uniref:Uncharacterized protein n=1 Tax=Stentor coeruleus TaxID=5963 RepID=A0A1R2AW57_9CILI|nr:hypothetical protein SteCoe_33702 [Stentor coeruleus]